MTEPVMVVLSGGQDSTTCAFWAKNVLKATEIHAVTFEYGQLHTAELEAAQFVADAVDATTYEVVRMGPILRGSSPLVSHSEKLEQYEDYKALPGGLEKTFVPARNALFLTLAANRAYCLGIHNLITGVCEEDSGGYPDCRQTFIDSMAETLALAHDFDFSIYTPLMDMTKAQSVDLALSIPGCYEALARSHTSYDGAYPPVGKDHATLLREKGFVEANVPDPLVVRAWLEGLIELPATGPYNILKGVEPTAFTVSELCEMVGAQ
tara:strand:- start:912 stop:1706 length:795 start_codon:yes stop_codon:yes gene_type:complete